jgi:hypothetical protein
MSPAVDDPLDDPIVRAEVDRAVEPYRATLTPAALEEMRNVLAVQLVSHPVLSRMLQRLRPPPVVMQSEELPTDGAEADSSKDAKRSTGTGGDD